MKLNALLQIKLNTTVYRNDGMYVLCFPAPCFLRSQLPPFIAFVYVITQVLVYSFIQYTTNTVWRWVILVYNSTKATSFPDVFRLNKIKDVNWIATRIGNLVGGLFILIAHVWVLILIKFGIRDIFAVGFVSSSKLILNPNCLRFDALV